MNIDQLLSPPMKLSISKDKNGNKIVRVSPSNGRGFSIQTLGNLPYIHAHGISSPYYAKLEVWDYVSQFGTKMQKQAIRNEGPFLVSRFAYDLHQ